MLILEIVTDTVLNANSNLSMQPYLIQTATVEHCHTWMSCIMEKLLWMALQTPKSIFWTPLQASWAYSILLWTTIAYFKTTAQSLENSSSLQGSSYTLLTCFTIPWLEVADCFSVIGPCTEGFTCLCQKGQFSFWEAEKLPDYHS